MRENWAEQAHYSRRPRRRDPTLDATPSPAQEISLREAFEQYMLMARVEGRSQATLRIYNDVFTSVLRHFRERRLLLRELGVPELRSYLEELRARGLQPTTLSIHYRVLRAFLNWCLQEGLLEGENPIKRIGEPRVPKSFPFILSDRQVTALLQAARAQRERGWRGFRNYLIVLTFLDTGLRLSELVNLNVTDIDLARRRLRIRGKGAKDRLCFMGARLTREMRSWLQIRGNIVRRMGLWGEEAVFIGHHGRLRKNYIERIVRSLGEKARIKGVRVSPHTLRHTAATLAVRNGLDPFALQQR